MTFAETILKLIVEPLPERYRILVEKHRSALLGVIGEVVEKIPEKVTKKKEIKVEDIIATRAERQAELDRQRAAKTMDFTVKVATDKLGPFNLSFNNLVKKANKLGVKPPQKRLVGTSVERFPLTDGTTIPFMVEEYHISYEIPDTDLPQKWVATIHHDTGLEGNLIWHRYGWTRDLPPRFRSLLDVEAKCELCDLKKAGRTARKTTYIVYDETKTGTKEEYRQCGTECFSVVMQGLTPAKVKHIVSVVDKLNDLSRLPKVRRPKLPDRPIRTKDTVNVLARAVQEELNRSRYSTWSAWTNWAEGGTPEARQIAIQALQWGAAIEPRGGRKDYDWNIKMAGLSERIGSKGMKALSDLWRRWPERRRVVKEAWDRLHPGVVEPVVEPVRPPLRQILHTSDEPALLEQRAPYPFGAIPVRVTGSKIINTSFGRRRLTSFRRLDINERLQQWSAVSTEHLTGEEFWMQGEFRGLSTYKGVTKGTVSGIVLVPLSEPVPEATATTPSTVVQDNPDLDDVCEQYRDRFRELYGMRLDRSRVNTRKGPREKLSAPPTDVFRRAWREHKQTLKDVGVSFGVYKGRWTVSVWVDPENPSDKYTTLPIAPDPTERRRGYTAPPEV